MGPRGTPGPVCVWHMWLLGCLAPRRCTCYEASCRGATSEPLAPLTDNGAAACCGIAGPRWRRHRIHCIHGCWAHRGQDRTAASNELRGYRRAETRDVHHYAARVAARRCDTAPSVTARVRPEFCGIKGWLSVVSHAARAAAARAAIQTCQCASWVLKLMRLVGVAIAARGSRKDGIWSVSGSGTPSSRP